MVAGTPIQSVAAIICGASLQGNGGAGGGGAFGKAGVKKGGRGGVSCSSIEFAVLKQPKHRTDMDLVVIAQWLQPLMTAMLQRLSTASRLLEGTESTMHISSSVQSLLTLLESSNFALGKGIALMFAKAFKPSLHAPNTEIHRMGDPCNQVRPLPQQHNRNSVPKLNRNPKPSRCPPYNPSSPTRFNPPHPP